MLYAEFMLKAKEDTVVQAENGLWYLEPDWRNILFLSQIDVENISDFNVSWSELENILKLEVEKRNTIGSLKPYVTNWLHDIIATTIEPTILEQETEFIKNLTDYLKTNKEVKESKE